MIPRLHDAHLELRDSALVVYLAFVFDEELRLSAGKWTPRKEEAIGARLHLSRRTVADAIAQLRRLGYIEAGTRVPGSPQAYRLVYEREEAA